MPAAHLRYGCNRRAVGSLRKIAVHFLGEQSNDDESANATQSASAKPQTLLSLRNAERINKAVQARHDPSAWETDEGIDTDTDLMIDRLHDLSE